MDYHVHLSLRSANEKTGPIPVSTTSAVTCPSACPLSQSGCYAKGGKLSMHWRAVTEGERGLPWDAFCDAVATLPAGTLWRHNQAGDLPGIGNRIDSRRLAELVVANAEAGAKGFTYTHKPMDSESNRRAVANANKAGFAVNLSADTLAEADELASLGIAPVVVVVPESAPEKLSTTSGRAVVVCPAQTRDDKTCADCGLCARINRAVIVGFRAHGAAKRRAEAVCRG